MINEVVDKNSGAILFKEDAESRKVRELGEVADKLLARVEELEERVEELEYKLRREE